MKKVIKCTFILIVCFITINLLSMIKVNAQSEYLASCHYKYKTDSTIILRVLVNKNQTIKYEIGKYDVPSGAYIQVFYPATESYAFNSTLTYSDFLSSQKVVCPRDSLKFSINGTDVNVSITTDKTEASNFDYNTSMDETLNNVNKPNRGFSNFFDCSNENFVKIIRLLKAFLQIIQIAVPIGLILLGTIDFGRAVISVDEEGMKKGQKSFFRRCAAAVAVFLVVMVVNLIMGLVAGSNADWQKCWNPDTAFIESTTKNYFS